MGAEQFFTVSLGRNPHQAFDKAVEQAYWDYGHGGYTGSIAEKDGFKFAGQVSTPHWRKVPDWFEREIAKRYPAMTAMRYKGRLPGTPIPPAYRKMVSKFVDIYEQKWGPAICYEVTGRARLAIKDEWDRHKTMDHVYVFCGYASS